jgi:hypothetical protein
MIFWVILSVAWAAMPTHRIVKTYTGIHNGWITLNLDRHTIGTASATVKSVDWCGSMYSNPPPGSKAVIRELVACADPGLRHVKLYQGPDHESLIMNEHSDPNVIYINPKNVGGWDAEHQAQIVVHAEFNGKDGKKHNLVEVYRFNTLYNKPILIENPVVVETQSPTEASQHVNAPTPTEASQHVNAPTPTEASQHVNAPPTPTEASQHVNAPPTPTEVSQHVSDPPPPSTDELTAWSGMGSLLGIGVIMLAFTAFLTYKKRDVISLPRWGKAEEEGDQPRLTLRPPSGEEDIENFFMVPSMKQEEDVNFQFLMDLGANDVYMQNY